jgi:hypothetical protein
MNSIKLIQILLSIFILAGCGEGESTTPIDSQQPAGSKTVNLTVVLQGSEAVSVKGIQTTISLPANVVFPSDASGGILNGVISPATGTPSGTIVGKYTAGANGVPSTVTIAFITQGTMSAGDLMTLTAELPPGVSVPATSQFTLNNSRFLDKDLNNMSGVSLVLR